MKPTDTRIMMFCVLISCSQLKGSSHCASLSIRSTHGKSTPKLQLTKYLLRNSSYRSNVNESGFYAYRVFGGCIKYYYAFINTALFTPGAAAGHYWELQVYSSGTETIIDHTFISKAAFTSDGLYNYALQKWGLYFRAYSQQKYDRECLNEYHQESCVQFHMLSM